MAILPDTLGGVPLSKNEISLVQIADAFPEFSEVLSAGDPGAGVALPVYANDPSGSVDALIFLFANAGASTAEMIAAFERGVDNRSAASISWTASSIGATNVETGTWTGTQTYVYGVDHLLFVVATNDPALATEAVTALPHPFPDPILGRAVYDPAGVLSASVEASLETEIDGIEARSGAQVVVYCQVEPGVTEESNAVAAQVLMGQWGLGRAGINDGFVILVSLQDNLLHGRVNTYAGAGLVGPLSAATQARLIDEVILPAFRSGDIEKGVVLAIAFVGKAIP